MLFDCYVSCCLKSRHRHSLQSVKDDALARQQEKIQAAACHLFDGEDCNASFVRSLMPGVPALLVNLSYRTQGFYVQKGNPKNIRGWQDLSRQDISVLNRRVGSVPMAMSASPAAMAAAMVRWELMIRS